MELYRKARVLIERVALARHISSVRARCVQIDLYIFALVMARSATSKSPVKERAKSPAKSPAKAAGAPAAKKGSAKKPKEPKPKHGAVEA